MSGRTRDRRTPHATVRPHAGLRTCVGCRARDERSALLRVVALDGNASTTQDVSSVELVPDERGRLPGRGAWLHPCADCLDLADRRRAFPRALRLTSPVDVSRVRGWISQHALDE
ncbi:YlxR family protein [Flexivirga meconopsidis]|uniref:YlxR family protein n=1 Tax=Flexivirga meconopsidis TaxID=2977121 RepID=UPI00223ED559|nr:YlxR family protein [Flexivirga meconopsidis]